jgi:UPF0271 protein
VVKIDLNSDLGEGYGTYRCGDDDAMLAIVTSANIACGLHAGDPEIMAQSFKRARELGVAVGAHPGFPDLWGFGRRNIPFTIGEIERLVAYQVGAAQAVAAYAGHKVTYVKAHGALGNLAGANEDAAMAVSRAVKAVDSSLVVLGIALSEQIKAAKRVGLAVVAEVFADRGYTDHGHLVPRGQPGAMIDDPTEAASRALVMVQEGAIITATGKQLKTSIDSICVHGDSPHATETALRVRKALEAAGITIAAFS